MSACEFAACFEPAAAVEDGWAVCYRHRSTESTWRAYENLRDWIGRLNHVGLTDTDIAGLLAISPCTARDHRKRLGLPPNRTEQQRRRDDRLLREADAALTRDLEERSA